MTAEQRVASAFRRHRTTQQLTISALADRARISKDRMQRLLAPDGQRFHLDEVVAVADALGMPQGDVMRLLWPRPQMPEMLPTRPPSESAQLLPEAFASPELAPTAQVVRSLTRSPNWAFAVAPVLRGPTIDVTVRITNRITLTPVPVSLRDATHDVLRERFLAEFGGLPPGASFTQPEMDGLDPSRPVPPGYDRGQLHITCAVFTADRPASSVPVELRAAADGIAVVGLRSSARSLTLSAVLARALGWGLLSTARTGRIISKHSIPDARASASKENLYANLVLGELLASCPPHTILSHVGTPVVDDDGVVAEEHALMLADPERLPYVVLVSESDALLERGMSMPVNARGETTRFALDQFIEWRDELKRHVLRLQAAGQGVVVEANPTWAGRLDLDQLAVSQLRWRDVALYSRHVLHDLFHRSGLRRSTFACRDAETRSILAFDSPITWH